MWDLTGNRKPRLHPSMLNAETLFGPAPRYDVQHNGRGQWIAREYDSEPGDAFGTGATADEAIRDLLDALQEETP